MDIKFAPLPAPLKVGLVHITPEIAEDWLGRNTHNRNIRQHKVKAWATDIAAGNWHFNGETIKIAVDDTVIDGQHRLLGVIEAGVGADMLVVYGLPPATQETVDGGLKRNYADVLHLRGEKYPNVLAAILRRATTWQEGFRRSGTFTPTNAQMSRTLEKYPWLRDAALAATRAAQSCDLPPSVIGLGIWLFSQIDDSEAEFFFARLADGQSLVSGDPIYELRRAADASKNTRGQRSETYLTAILIKAWNAYIAGDRIQVLTFRAGGSRPRSSLSHRRLKARAPSFH